jgi:hypothetical protein
MKGTRKDCEERARRLEQIRDEGRKEREAEVLRMKREQLAARLNERGLSLSVFV